MKLLFITNVPSPYRVDFFNELGKHCSLTVLFEKRTSDERDSSWKNYKFETFEGVFLKGKSINTDSAVCFGVRKYVLDRSYDAIIVANVSSPTGMIAISCMKAHKISYCIEGDGGFAKSGKGFKEKVKKFFISGACGYFSTSKEHDRYYITYGADPERIIRYPFTSLKASDLLESALTDGEKAALRKELGISEKRMIIAVGRFIPLKRFDLLIKSAKLLSDDVGVYFVGGIPTEEYLTLAEGRPNIHFEGFKDKETLKKYYKASDIFVLPSSGEAWGLVVNEAMSNALPVLTTDRCTAGLELVREGVNGCIVPVGDLDALAEKLSFLLSSDLDAMGRASLEIIKEYTIEKMAEAHMKALGTLDICNDMRPSGAD